MNRSRLFSLVSVFTFVLGATSAYAHAPGVTLKGFGTPTIDGVLSPGEWDSAGSISFPVNIPASQGGGTVQGTLFVMNDETNLYLAIEFPYTATGNTASFQFDNDHGGGNLANGDDGIGRNSTSFFDIVRTSEPPCTSGLCGLFDTTVGGTNDGMGAFSNAGGVTVYEFSHPLDSADDAHDFSLSPGDIIGFGLSLRLIVPPSNWPDDYADTGFPSALAPNAFGDIRIASKVLEVVIDIKPGESPNCFNINGRGVIPVAVLGSGSFNVYNIDQSTLSFAGLETRVRGNRDPFCSIEHANGDEYLDLVCQFEDDPANWEASGSAEAAVSGSLFDTTKFEGTDTICVVQE